MSDDLTRLTSHPAVIDAALLIEQDHGPFLESQAYDVRAAIAAAVAKVLADAASQSAIDLCKTIVNFEQFGGIPTVARLVDAYADTKVQVALSQTDEVKR